MFTLWAKLMRRYCITARGKAQCDILLFYFLHLISSTLYRTISYYLHVIYDPRPSFCSKVNQIVCCKLKLSSRLFLWTPLDKPSATQHCLSHVGERLSKATHCLCYMKINLNSWLSGWDDAPPTIIHCHSSDGGVLDVWEPYWFQMSLMLREDHRFGCQLSRQEHGNRLAAWFISIGARNCISLYI